MEYIQAVEAREPPEEGCTNEAVPAQSISDSSAGTWWPYRCRLCTSPIGLQRPRQVSMNYPTSEVVQCAVPDTELRTQVIRSVVPYTGPFR